MRKTSKHDDPFVTMATKFHQVRTLRYLQAFLGLVLIVAGILKFSDFATADQDEDSAALLFMLLAEVELLGGLWLVWGANVEQARPWAIAIFAGLWAASLYQILDGRCSCGCFGSLVVNPWFTLIFDLAAVILLLKWRPESDEAVIPFGSYEVLGLPLLALLFAIGGIWYQALVVVKGTANLHGSPLVETPLVFTGDSVKVQVNTNHEGYFQSVPLRPGRYAVSLPKGVSSSNPSPKPSNRNLESKSALGRSQQKASLVPARKKARRSHEGPGEPTSGAAESEVVLLEVDGCSANDLVIEFP